MKMSGALAIAIAIAVVGQVLYHSVARGLEPGRSAFVIVGVAYAVALVSVTAVGAGLGQLPRADLTVRTVVSGVALGIAVAMVEVGYVYAYRRGLAVSTGALSVLALTTVALVPIALVVYHESLSPRIVAGAGIALLGLWMMRG